MLVLRPVLFVSVQNLLEHEVLSWPFIYIIFPVWDKNLPVGLYLVLLTITISIYCACFVMYSYLIFIFLSGGFYCKQMFLASSCVSYIFTGCDLIN